MRVQPRGRVSDEAAAGRAAPDGEPGPGQVPGLPPPGREGPLARRLAPAPGRRVPHPGPGRGGRRAVGHHRPGCPEAVERARPSSLADGRRGNGAAPKLDPDQRAALLAALKQRPPDGGLWTGPKVAAYVRSRWGVRVCPQTGWQWLRDLGFTLQVP